MRCAICTVLALGIQQTGVGVESFVRDPPDQLFRCAAMAESPRSVVIPLATNVHLAFDTQLLRTVVVWEGPGLNLQGPPYMGRKSPFLSDFDGVVLWSNPPIFPWSAGKEPRTSDLTIHPAGARFNSISTKRNAVTLVYEVPVPGGKSFQVRETPRALKVGSSEVVLRRMEIGPCSADAWFLAHAETGNAPEPQPPSSVVFERTNDVLLVTARTSVAVTWDVENHPIDLEYDCWTENKLDSELAKRRITGNQSRACLRIPAHTNDVVVEILSAACPTRREAFQLEKMLASGPMRPAGRDDAASAGNGGLVSSKVFGPDTATRLPNGGDEHYQIEHFPVPQQINLLVGGLDWLSNGDLAVCTWPGEVYVVENAQGPPTAATYRRFARGLDEPLGLKVFNGHIYVVQKFGLTRLSDTDGDGEADLYETVNNDWGFTGNYHSFAFGPAMDAENNFYVFLAGQRGHWNVPYVGWCVRINAERSISEGYCDGLRAPNGWATFGPDHDLFVTDNQGEWIGTCKLNHLQPGKFYGFPSGYPAQEADYAKAKTFEPPAVWFPRKLSSSASGIAVIADDRFGPFKGQMLVGDFQNSIVMRVSLEKVNGQWQGAVWPFASGFLSGVNRLVMGPDGKLYVGGLKNRAWPAFGPKEYSLDRVAFTGRSPFEVKEVHAMRDGLELTFTEPVDAAGAGNADNYAVSQFTYKYSGSYGSPEFDHEGNQNSATEIEVANARVSADGLSVRLPLSGWRAGCVTTVRVLGVTSPAGERLRHDTFYYTLNRIPE